MKKLLLILTVLLAACVIRPAEVDTVTEQGPYYDVTEHDILTMIDDNMITGNMIAVEGVRLGDSLPEVIDHLGVPQYIDEFPSENIVNVKYENEQGDATLNLHIKDDEVQRITIKTPYNENLVGNSQLQNWHLHNITSAFGKPDVSYDTSFWRVYEYHDLGLELYHKRKQLLGFSIIPVNESE